MGRQTVSVRKETPGMDILKSQPRQQVGKNFRKGQHYTSLNIYILVKICQSCWDGASASWVIFFFFFFFFIQFYVPFKLFHSYRDESIGSVGGAKTGVPGEKPPDTPASRTWLVSHMNSCPVRGANPHR